ncbi:MAG: 30S ribosomal protein S8 [Geovibrio sp.]|jgi:small subunit ribosomal protein S8|uniref:30S ribosomal protein S8 n=1 Tax=Geovibrio ferrireducens TaxID=46201 RepID=UPI0022453610|nr:30S ribosomal protein S8 [Geovibrio ferrireducens]MCD8569086.1 30S ribosomal protein S8 [Geovibrio sp.]
MSMTDPIADMLARLRNAYMVKKSEVVIPHSKIKEAIVENFRVEGYVKSFRVVSEENLKKIVVYLKYTDGGESVIRGLKRVSKPGRRVYVNNKNLKPVLGGLGNGIISTSEGVKTVKQCILDKVGGEYICQIW